MGIVSPDRLVAGGPDTINRDRANIPPSEYNALGDIAETCGMFEVPCSKENVWVRCLNGTSAESRSTGHGASSIGARVTS